MSKHAMSEPEAFRWIQRAAMDNRTSMRSVAELVLSGDASG
jgi:two-component system, response regulator PdtaR